MEIVLVSLLDGCNTGLLYRVTTILTGFISGFGSEGGGRGVVRGKIVASKY